MNNKDMLSSLLLHLSPKEKDEIFSFVSEEEKIFLHTCCAPCAEWPVAFMREMGFSVSAFFYNPNIHPIKEYQRRLENVENFARMKKLPLITENAYMEEEWCKETWKESYSSRCDMCYSVRMDQSAHMAKEMGFRFFTTSLLVSPYQDFDAIIKAGHMAAKKEGIHFLPFDFRAGFRKGQEMAREDGLYRQKFCGCIFSLASSKFKEQVYAELESYESQK